MTVADGFRVRVGRGKVEVHGAGGSDCSDRGVRTILSGGLHYRGAPARRGGARAVLDLYRAGGVQGLLTIEGDFALVVIDLPNNRIAALRDAMGGRPLFWRREPEGWAIGSSLQALFDRRMDQLDPGYIADRLLSGSPSADQWAGSPYRDIWRLRPGHLLDGRVEEPGPRIHAAADWASRIRETCIPAPEAAAEEFRCRLTEAVRERATDKVAAHVSGGMDSTSVALIAARIRPPVHGLALRYKRIEPLRREAAFIDLVRHPGLAVGSIEADDLLDFDGFATIGPHAEPTPWLFRAAQDLALFQRARDAGATTILTGEGADETLALPPIEIADDMRRWRIGKAHAESARWARAYRTSVRRFVSELGLAAAVAPRFFRPERPGWLNPDFAAEVDWDERARALARRRLRHEDSFALSEMVSRIENSAGDWTAQELARPMGLDVAHPFRDPRVLVYGAAARLTHGADAMHPKPLLARAMAGIVPAPILGRRGKAPFDPIFYLGLSRNRDSLLRLVGEAPKVADRFFIRDRLIEAVRDAALGYRGLQPLHDVASTLSILKWLALLPRWQAGEGTALPKPDGRQG